jgi:endo-1,4-beta-xylanase
MKNNQKLATNTMTNQPPQLTRRSLLAGAAAISAHALAAAVAPIIPPQPVPDTTALRQAARKCGILLGTYTVSHELVYDPTAAAIIDNTFGMIADGNDLKFSNRLRPTPDTFDFATGDIAVNWAEAHHKLVRGHCLVWWNALPHWFSSYVTAANAQQVMTNHITTVVKHYAGRIYSWDVVNEMIHNDGRPDQLRRKPWLDFLGPQYIDIAFHTAAAADPHARLILNECYVEHATPAEKLRRDAYLQLATRLKQANVPITGVGVQGHLRNNVPIDADGMTTFCKQLQDLGLDLLITELDVDDSGLSPDTADQIVAAKYREFLDIVGPYAASITLESVRDQPEFKRPDGLMHRMYLWDDQDKPTPAYTAVTEALAALPPKSNSPRRATEQR